jgi:hypothetical protein
MADKRAPRRDEEVDSTRTIFWFRTLCDYLDDERPRAIQRLIDPISIRTDREGDRIRNNKFKSYAEGKHVPSTTLVSAAKKVVKDSERSLNHVFWEVLRERGSVKDKATQWVQRLTPDIQAIVFGTGLEVAIRGDRHFLGSLERRDSMDGLAMLTILLKLSFEENDHEQAWDIAHSIFKVLLMIGSELDEKLIADRVFNLYRERIFSLVYFKDQVVDLGSYKFLKVVDIVATISSSMRTKQGNYRERKMRSYYPLKVINGFDGIFALPVRQI